MPKNSFERTIDSKSGLRSGGAGGFGAGGAITDHGLLSGLLDDDHPDYLNIARGDARYYTELEIDAWRTAHLVPNAHHNPVTVAAPLTVTVEQALGLTLGHGVETSGNALRVRRPTNSGLALDASGLSVGQPLTLGVATTNVVSGIQHSHAVDSSSDPGAAAKLLATNPAGELALVAAYLQSVYVGILDFGADTLYEDATYLQVAGTKDVNFGLTIRAGQNWSMTPAGELAAATGNFAQDLYAAQSAFRVINHTHDYPHSHIVINPGPSWNLDEQFGLDVDDNLLVRGWIVGKHAIQVKDALMICHFDGPEPYSTNFAGNATGHLGQPGAATGGVIYRPGKFGKAVQVARGLSNQFVDPSCEYDANLTLWTQSNVTATRSADVAALYGGYAGKLVTTDVAGLFCQTLTLTGVNRALAVYVRKANGGAVTAADCSLYFNGDVTTAYQNVGGGWWRMSYSTGSAPTNVAIQIGVRVQANATVYVDGLLLQNASIISSYIDGSLGAGHTWSGTPHASTTTRTAASLSHMLKTVRYDAPLTIMAWVDMRHGANSGLRYLWWTGGDAYSAWSNNATLYVGGVNCGAVPMADWTHVALVTAGDGTVFAYVNGAYKGTAAITRTDLTSIHTGGRASDGWLNGLVDDLAVIERAVSADEIRAVYESNAPIFAETSTWHWRAGRNRFWADAEGMWMFNAAGQPMLGAYAGDDLNPDATKTWGGVTLAASDVLIGDANRGGYVRWSDDAATMEFKGKVIITEGSGYAALTDRPTNLAAINASEGTKLGGIQAGATVGATWGTNLGSIPLRFTDAPVNGTAGLHLTATRMGYWNGSAWKMWMNNAGQFYFGGDTGARLQWDGSILAGYDASNVVQWSAGASNGSLLAGGGNVALNAGGLNLHTVQAWNDMPAARIGWYDNPTAKTGLAGLIGAGPLDAIGNRSGMQLEIAGAALSGLDADLWFKRDVSTYRVWHAGNLDLSPYALASALTNYAPLAGATFTGDISAPSVTATGHIVSGAIGVLGINSRSGSGGNWAVYNPDGGLRFFSNALGADSLLLAADGKIQTAGALGIGVAAASGYALDVNGAALVRTNLRLGNSGSTDPSSSMADGETRMMIVQVSGSTRRLVIVNRISQSDSRFFWFDLDASVDSTQAALPWYKSNNWTNVTN